ncbi:hypothetical protein [Tardiphaga sp.]|uniref:hypothetical protein n=1 Tax=Tardiphaga sp. TaxID=1926292 RepID=UPI00352AB694
MKHPSQHKSNLITAPSEGERGAIASESSFLQLSEMLKLYGAAIAFSQEFGPISFPKIRPIERLRGDTSRLGRRVRSHAPSHETDSERRRHRRCADRATPHGFRRSAATLFHHGAHAGDSVGRKDSGSEDQKS